MELKLLSKRNLDAMNELVQFEDIGHALQLIEELIMELKLLSKRNLDAMSELVQFEEIDHALQL